MLMQRGAEQGVITAKSKDISFQNLRWARIGQPVAWSFSIHFGPSVLLCPELACLQRQSVQIHCRSSLLEQTLHCRIAHRT